MAILFRDDDASYLTWVIEHPGGFVVNLRKNFDPTYLVLHRAMCPSIRKYPGMYRNPGGFTERGYMKLCSLSINDLESYLKKHPPFSSRCGLCNK